MHPPAPSPADAAERQLRLLAELVDIGMTIARTLPAQAARQAARQAAPAPAPASDPPAADAPTVAIDASLAFDPSLAFARIERAIRQAFILESKIREECERRSRHRQDMRSHRRLLRSTDATRKYRDRVKRRVEQAISAAADPDDADTLLEDLDDLLEDEEITSLFSRIPDQAIAEKIIRDIGLADRASAPSPAINTPGRGPPG